MVISVLICDDHLLMQRGVQSLLKAAPDMQIVGTASDTNEAIQLAHEHQPNVALMDISMPGAGGIEAARRITSALPHVRVLMLTVHEDVSILKEALQAGAAGYIVKRAAESELLDAIRAANRGDTYIHPTMTNWLLQAVADPQVPASNGVESLTPRELEVLCLLVRGNTNRQIAEKLSLSVRTVETHRANITGKLGVHTRVDLVNYVEKNQLEC